MCKYRTGSEENAEYPNWERNPLGFRKHVTNQLIAAYMTASLFAEGVEEYVYTMWETGRLHAVGFK